MSPVFEHIMQDGGGLYSAVALVVALLIGHVLADYPLQGEFLATGKNRHNASHIPVPGKGDAKHVWVHCMTSHCLVHATFVWIVTGLALYAFIEFVLHFIIDYIKCEDWTTYTQDQLLHVACKVIYVILILNGVGVPG